MDEFIAKANIKHLQGLLEAEQDQAKRKVLSKLVAEEEEKLAKVLRQKMNDEE